jgi:DNA-binding CsgD family transcriptional regulator
MRQIIDEFIETSNKARTVEELFEYYRAAMKKIGFDRLVFSLMTDHPSIQRPAGHGILVNYSEDWMKHYVQSNCEIYDPVRRNMYSAPGTFAWDKLMERPTMTGLQRNFMNDATDAGLHDGIGIPLRGPRGAIAGVGAASSAGGVELEDKNLMSYANLLSHQFYTVYLTLETERLDVSQQFVYLSDREQEVLKWCARGKTKSEIGDLLSLSEHTIHGYIKSALKKLDANNTTLGVLKALHMGLIQL